MRRHTILLAGCAFLALGAGAAHADCAEELAALSGEGGVAKDGTLAPLEGAEGQASEETATADTGPSGTGEAAEGDTEAAAAGEGIAKDGSTAPLEEGSDSGEDAAAVATSPQDVQAQQEGEAPAAMQAEAGDPERETAIQRARTALAAGDEAGCMEALETIRGL